MKKAIIVVAIVIVVGGVLLVVVRARNDRGQDGIKTFPVERGAIVDKALALGSISPRQEIAVKSKISGIVEKVFVEVGDEVKRGNALINISPDPTPLEYADAKRASEIAEIAYETAQSNFERAVELREKALISQREYEVASQEFNECRLRMQLAEEKLSLIEEGKTTIANRDVETVVKSPIDGVVLQRFVNQGDAVVPLTTYQAGTPLFTLADMRDLIFKGTVDEIDVGKLSEGMKARIKVGALPNEVVEGTLNKISPKARKEENTTLFDLEIEINQEGSNILRAGYSANADVIIQEKADVLMIPERLVHFEGDSASVEVQLEDGVIETRPVIAGLSDGLNVEVVEGLAEGDLVVERPPKEIE